MSMSFQHPLQESQLDIFGWHPKFRSCLVHFIHYAQHTSHVKTVAAFVNIKLPFQRTSLLDPPDPPRMASGSGSGSGSAPQGSGSAPEMSSDKTEAAPQTETLVPYIRRLVATGLDSPDVLQGFFGDDWSDGIGPIHEAERRNYLFAAKSDTWLRVKASYDMDGGQNIPFLKPLQGVTEKEIQAAETSWSEWLAMQDWMLGPRAPAAVSGSANQRMAGGQD